MNEHIPNDPAFMVLGIYLSILPVCTRTGAIMFMAAPFIVDRNSTVNNSTVDRFCYSHIMIPSAAAVINLLQLHVSTRMTLIQH